MSEDSGEEENGEAESASERAQPIDRSGDEDAPLSGLADKISERRRQTEKRGTAGGRPAEDTEPSPAEVGTDSDGDPFEEMSVSEIDEETLWDSLEDESDPGPELSVGAEPAGGPETMRTTHAPPEAREHVVSKEDYCQKCPYLDDPPELACTHEGTEIVEVVDSERFRVRECPMVEE